MTRFLSWMLLLVLGLPVVAPALGPSRDAAMPACCRKAGAHHCMGGMQGATGMALRAPKCAAYPAAVGTAGHGDAGLAAGSWRVDSVVGQPALRARAMARARVAREKGLGTRGPPVLG